MEPINLMKHVDVLDTGYGVTILVNTKGKGVPNYLMSFISAQIRETNRVFDIPVLFDITSNNKELVKVHPTIKSTDTIIQLLCRINVALPEKDFSLYMEEYLSEVMFPFMLGCNFEILTWFHTFNMPQDMSKTTYIEGTKSIIIKEKAMPNAMRVIFKDMFNMGAMEIDRAEGMFGMVGSFRIDNCLKEDEVEDCIKGFDRIGITIEIE